MNYGNSMTGKTESSKDTGALTRQWETIDWKQVQRNVNRLQTRIAKAAVLKSLTVARNGEGMLEPYERETLTYGS